MGVTWAGEAKREAPAQAELRPTCAAASRGSFGVALNVGAIVAAPAVIPAKIGVIGHIIVVGSRVRIWVWVRIRVGGLIGALIHLSAVFIPLVGVVRIPLIVIVIDNFGVLGGCGPPNSPPDGETAPENGPGLWPSKPSIP